MAQNFNIQRLLILLALPVLVVSCKTKPVQSQKPVKVETTPPIVQAQSELPTQAPAPVVSSATSPELTPPTPPPVSARQNKAAPQFALIFSGGGAKAWAHIGVLKEMQKYKFPFVSVGGMEWGAVVAASFAGNLSSNEVEWEMSKFKNVEESGDFIKAVFTKKTTAELKVPFVCPSLNLKTQTAYLLNRGNLDQLIPYCLSAAGLARPYGQSVALMTDFPTLVQHVRATGAQKVILVNVLAGKNNAPFLKGVDSLENQIWVESAAMMTKKIQGVDEVIEINLSDIQIDDFDERRDAMLKGGELSANQIKKIADKYGL